MMPDEDFKAYLEESGYNNVRKLADGWVGIIPFIHTHGICTELDMTGYNRRYCFEDRADCEREIAKMQSVADIPEGWIRRIPEAFYFTIVGRDDHVHIGQCMTEREIVTAARLAVSSNHPYHFWEVTPSVDEALKHLNGEGRVFEVFDASTEWRAFLVRAETLGLGAEATRLVQSVEGGR